MSAADPERDARLFPTDVYRDQPEGTVISVGTRTKHRFVRSPEDAIPYVLNRLDHGGPRSTLEQLAGLVTVEANGRGPDSATDVAPVGVRELLEQLEQLAKIVKHQGTKPKDSSPSGWDNMLACRAAELGIRDKGELAALIRHHRSTLKDPAERAKGRRYGGAGFG